MKAYTGEEIKELIEKAKTDHDAPTGIRQLHVKIAMAMMQFNRGHGQGYF